LQDANGNPIYCSEKLNVHEEEGTFDGDAFGTGTCKLYKDIYNVLTGKKINGDNFLGFYDSQISVIPEGDHYQLFGWLAPNFKKFTSTNTMGASLCKKSRKVLDTNLNGGIRPLIMTGNFEKVFPFDIYPMQLIKACIIKDIDQMEELGIYEIDAEDFALCEVIDPSKTPIQQIVREGLELLRKEMN
jgi:Na+-transporting NADH:ubiquinone oxidoreductase subunit A